MAHPLDEIRSFLDRRVRVRIVDGRVIEGNFQCLDKDLNVVLSDSAEYYNVENDGSTEMAKDLIMRVLGMSIIPGQHIVKLLLRDSEESNV